MARALAVAAALLLAAPPVMAQASDSELVVLDPGHIPSYPGAAGACGKKEVAYNDAMAGDIRAALNAVPGLRTQLTRRPGKSVLPADDSLPPQPNGRESAQSFLARTALANRLGAALFVSIHHDSTDDRNIIQDPAACGGRGGTRIKPEFKAAHHIGYNIWVYQGDAADRPRYEESLKLAVEIGRRMRAAGLTASDIHIQPFEDCRSCRPVDKANGVWKQDLAVLRTAKMPAVLVECANIADADLEAQTAASPEYRQRVVKAVADGVAAYAAARAQPPRPLASAPRVKVPALDDAVRRLAD